MFAIDRNGTKCQGTIAKAMKIAVTKIAVYGVERQIVKVNAKKDRVVVMAREVTLNDSTTEISRQLARSDG